MRNYKTSAFQKRHYEAVAELLRIAFKREACDVAGIAAVEAIRDDFIATFKADNSKFDPGRFREACKPKS
jgi:hypothetical protein